MIFIAFCFDPVKIFHHFQGIIGYYCLKVDILPGHGIKIPLLDLIKTAAFNNGSKGDFR